MTHPLPPEKMCPDSLEEEKPTMEEEKPAIKRRRTEIELIKDNSKRQVTFTKRRQGLIRKARDLSERCDAEIAVMAVSAAGNFYAFGNPTFDGVVERYKAEKSRVGSNDIEAAEPTHPSENSNSGQSGWREDEESPDNSLVSLVLSLALPSKEKGTTSSSSNSISWDSEIDNMNLEELKQFVDSLEDSLEEKKKRVIERANQIARSN